VLLWQTGPLFSVYRILSLLLVLLSPLSAVPFFVPKEHVFENLYSLMEQNKYLAFRFKPIPIQKPQ